MFEETFSDTNQGVIDGLEPSTTYRVRLYAIDRISNRRSLPVTIERTVGVKIEFAVDGFFIFLYTQMTFYVQNCLETDIIFRKRCNLWRSFFCL